MEKYLHDKIAIVTGAGKGIGRAEALMLASRGATVVVNDISKSLDEAFKTVDLIQSQGGRAIPFQADVSMAEQVSAMAQATLEKFGRIDILVNNAGIVGKYAGKTVVDLPEEGWDEIMTVNLKGTYLCIRYLAPAMIKQKSGKIINTASIHGQIGGRPGMGSYGAAKAGVIALTKTCARELAPYGILVNAISPGYVDTEALSHMRPAFREDLVHRQIPLRRIATPEEVGELVSWLVSPYCTYMTGSIVDVNGGRIEYLSN